MKASADPRAALATRLREAREYLGLSQDDAALALGISRPAISNIESGSRKVEALELESLANLYGVTVTYLLNGKQEQESEAVAFYARSLKGLSAADLEEVARFAQFLKAGVTAKKAKPRTQE